MGRIDKINLDIQKEEDNFLNYDEKALFNTKIASDMKHNGELVEVVVFLKGKDVFSDRYIVRFNDGTINDNIMNIELEFNYEKENAKKLNKKDREAR